MKTQFAKHARRASRAKSKPEVPASTIDVSRSVWNTLGAVKLLGLSAPRLVRAVASGQLPSSRRLIGGDGKPRFAFSHGDLLQYAEWLVLEDAERERRNPAYTRERASAVETIKALVR